MATKTVQHSFSPQKSGTLPPTETVASQSSDDSQTTLTVTPIRGNEENVQNGVKKVAGVVFTPTKEAFAQRIQVEAEFTSPDARRVVARQEQYRRFPHFMGALSPSATQPRKVYTTPNSVRAVSRILGKGTQGEVVLTDRIFNDSQREPQQEALKIYDRKCKSWELMDEIPEDKRTFINLPSKIYPVENGRYAACLPLAETDLAQIDLSGELNPIQKLFGWIRDIAEGVEELHFFNILHRDLKPGNILVLKGRQTAQAADLDLAARMEQDEHFTTCTPYYSHPSIWGNDIMKQKIRKGIQTKADDVYSLGRTIQYGVIGKIFGMHDETKGFLEAMRPKKIDLPLDEQEADQKLLELVAQNTGTVMISGFRKVTDLGMQAGYRYVPSVVHVFPSRDALRSMTLHGIDELRRKLDRVEMVALRLAANVAHELQHDTPAQRPTMKEARLQIEASQTYLDQLNRPLFLPDLQTASSLHQVFKVPPSVPISLRPAYDDNPRETKRRKGSAEDDQ